MFNLIEELPRIEITENDAAKGNLGGKNFTNECKKWRKDSNI